MQATKAFSLLLIACAALIFAVSYAVDRAQPTYSLHRVTDSGALVRLNTRTGEVHFAVPRSYGWTLVPNAE